MLIFNPKAPEAFLYLQFFLDWDNLLGHLYSQNVQADNTSICRSNKNNTQNWPRPTQQILLACLLQCDPCLKPPAGSKHHFFRSVQNEDWTLVYNRATAMEDRELPSLVFPSILRKQVSLGSSESERVKEQSWRDRDRDRLHESKTFTFGASKQGTVGFQ